LTVRFTGDRQPADSKADARVAKEDPRRNRLNRVLRPQMDAEKPLLMDQVQYAKHRGKTKQYTNKLVKAGVLAAAHDQS
jgi:hypothetical protein